MILKHKICPNCGAVMLWNLDKERWECNLCGNVEELKENLKGFRPNYV